MPDYLRIMDANTNAYVGTGAIYTNLVSPSGNAVDVNVDGQMHTVMRGKISAGNSSSTPLATSATFVGSAVDTLDHAVITLMVRTDQPSATDGLCVEFSSDATNWDSDDVYTIPANTGKTFSFQPQAKYVRTCYTNGATAQTEFRMQTILKKTYVKPSSHRIQDSIIDDDDAELAKSVITGKAPDGHYHNVGITHDGDLTISDNSNGLAIAQGNVTGATFIHKFGHAPDFDTGDNEVTIWDGADDSDTDQMAYVFATADRIDSLSSGSGADTQVIEVQGLDANYALVTQTATLIGQTRVALKTDLLRVFRMVNVNSVDNAGHVVCYENTTLSSGIPTDTTKIKATIHPGNNQTTMAVYTVPAGKTAYMRDWYANTAGGSRDTNYVIKVKVRPFGQVFQLKHISALAVAGSSAIQHSYNEPEVFAEKTDIIMTAQITAAAITGASVSGGFDIVLVDN
jgi:hypothetical protein